MAELPDGQCRDEGFNAHGRAVVPTALTRLGSLYFYSTSDWSFAFEYFRPTVFGTTDDRSITEQLDALLSKGYKRDQVKPDTLLTKQIFFFSSKIIALSWQ